MNLLNLIVSLCVCVCVCLCVYIYIQKEVGVLIQLYHVFDADIHWKRAGVSEPLQKVGSVLRRTGEGLSLQGTTSTTATHVSMNSLFGHLP